MSVADFFNRLGKLAGELQDTSQHQTAMHDSVYGASGISSQYTDADRHQIANVIGNVDTRIAAFKAFKEDLRDDAHTTVIDEMNSLDPLVRLHQDDALRELIEQMLTAGSTISEPTVSSGSVSYGAGNTGTAVVVMSVTGWEGEQSDLLHSVRAETIRFEVETDAQTGMVESGRELWRMTGEASLDNLDRLWAAGSGINRLIAQVHAGIDETEGPGGNLVVNGSFEAFTSNKPDNWVNLAPTGGGTDYQQSSDSFRGDSSLEILGLGGGVRDLLEQNFNKVGESIARLKPNTKYLLSFWIKDGTTAPTVGTLRFTIRDNADTGYLSSIVTVDLNLQVSGSWQHKFVVWETPENLLGTNRILIDLTTDMQSGASVVIDELLMTEMHRDPARLGSPSAAIIAGETDSVVADTASVAITRTGGVLLLLMDLAYGMHESGIHFNNLLASEASATYRDTLVS